MSSVTSTYSLRSKGKAASNEAPLSTTANKKRPSPVKKVSKIPKKKAKIEDAKTEEKSDTTTKSEGHGGHTEQSELLEKGFIYFFYKPKVDEESVSSLSEVQRLFVVLWPQSKIYKKGDAPNNSRNHKRIIMIPKKSLPSTSQHTRFFGVVETVSDSLNDITKSLDPTDYETKTTGQHHLSGARPVGEGIYGIVQHGNHTHLAYVLEMPQKLGEVQKAMNIKKESSMIITIKSGKESNAKFPSHLEKVFEGRKYNPVNPVELLNYEGGEIILIGAKDDLVVELGEVGEELERLEAIDEQRLTDDKLFKELLGTIWQNSPCFGICLVHSSSTGASINV